MSAYREKSLEEAHGIIDVFLENHEARTGVKPNAMKLMEELRALKETKVKENFDAIFGTLSPRSLENCILALKKFAETQSPESKETLPAAPKEPQKTQTPEQAKDPHGKGKWNIMPNAKR